MKFARARREELSINLTPLIDVVFLLLIFFMITTTFTRDSQLEINLPEASAGESVSEEQRQIEVMISAEGLYSINGQHLVNTQPLTLRRAILELAEERRDLPFIITADAVTPHQAVVTAMDVAGQLGFSRLSITTQDGGERAASE